MKQELEKMAADVLLGAGISVPVKSIFGWKRQITVHAPTYGDMIYIGRMYREMNVTHEQLCRMTFEEKADLIARQGKAVSRMVATGIVRLPCFRGVAAWWLRHFVHPVALEEIWMVMLSLIRTSPFEIIIPSAGAMNLLAPTGSQ